LWVNLQTDSHLETRESYDLRSMKGSYVLWMLRTIMQNLQSKNRDADFIAMMHDFVQSCEGTNPSTADFDRIAGKHCGQPLDWFFNEWVYGTETPTYSFKYQLISAAQGKTALHRSLSQSGVSNSFRMRVPLYIDLKSKPRLVGLIAIQVNARLPVRPEEVAIGVDHSLLAVEHEQARARAALREKGGRRRQPCPLLVL
jgi:aminopeptidase N